MSPCGIWGLPVYGWIWLGIWLGSGLEVSTFCCLGEQRVKAGVSSVKGSKLKAGVNARGRGIPDQVNTVAHPCHTANGGYCRFPL